MAYSANCQLKWYHFLHDNDNRLKCILPTYMIDNFHSPSTHSNVLYVLRVVSHLNNSRNILLGKKVFLFFIFDFDLIFLLDCRLSLNNVYIIEVWYGKICSFKEMMSKKMVHYPTICLLLFLSLGGERIWAESSQFCFSVLYKTNSIP